MKRSFCILILLSLLLCACGRQEAVPVMLSAPPTVADSETAPQNRTVRVAVAQLLADSDLVRQMEQRFSQQTPYRLELSPNSNSTAVSVGQSGKADVLLVQQGTAVSQLVSAGYGDSAIPLFSDSLVLVGPAQDPAQVRSAETVAQAMVRIAQSDAVFVSRYDDSDVYRTEMRLWADAGVVIGNGRAWYKVARQGMSGTLQTAAEKGGYTLASREAFLREDTDLHILMQDVPALQNTYCAVPVSAQMFETVNAEGAEAFVQWLLQSDTQAWIQEYGTEDFGRPIFDMKTTMEG